MALSKRNDPLRKLRSVRRHLTLMIPPCSVACLSVWGWSWLRAHEIHFPIEDEVSLTTAIMSLGGFFAILAAIVMGTIWEKHQKVSVCVVKRDRQEFLLYRDERMPIVIHLLLGSLAVPLVLMVMLLEYTSFWSGFAAVATVSFGITIYWIVATELQDPARSPWFAERIPQEWLTADIDEVFKLDPAVPANAEH